MSKQKWHLFVEKDSASTLYKCNTSQKGKLYNHLFADATWSDILNEHHFLIQVSIYGKCIL